MKRWLEGIVGWLEHRTGIETAVRSFLLEKNPNAAREMAERLVEATERGLWRPRSNAAPGELRRLAGRTTGEAA